MTNHERLISPVQPPLLSPNRLQTAIAELANDAHPHLQAVVAQNTKTEQASSTTPARRLPLIAITGIETGRPHLTRNNLIDELEGYRRVRTLLFKEVQQ